MPVAGNTASGGKRPTTPTIGTATAGDGAATVAYTPSTYIGKGTITYTATSSPGGLQGTGTSPITVSGLTNGTSYTFTVTGTTNYGVTSAASATSNAVTPVSTPSCTPGCGPYSVYSTGAWSAWSTCAFSSATCGGTQSRSRTVTYSRTCTNADCSTYTDFSTSTESESRSCALSCPGGTTIGNTCTSLDVYYGSCSTVGECNFNIYASGPCCLLFCFP